MNADELREIRNSLEADLENINKGFVATHALEQGVVALSAALSVLLQHLIDSAEQKSCPGVQ